MTSTTQHPTTESPAAQDFRAAERRLLGEFGVAGESRRLALADPSLHVRFLETGDGEPTLMIHGSGMSAPTWAPLLAELRDRRVHAVDLPGFGLSDPLDYTGRPLRRHAVAQVGSMLDALGLERARIVGTSLGAMWALCMALEKPERVVSVVGFGIPAVSLSGMRGNSYFRAMTTPGVRAVVRRVPPPKSPKAMRRASVDAMGRHAVDRMPDAYFDVMSATMQMPGWRTAMYTHLNLALRSGKPRPENLFSDAELRSIEVPVRFVFGDRDVYGGPEVGERAVKLMPDARLDVLPGGHAPFVDDPVRCAELIRTAP
jgi:pimeloyl-ACP methyl ester carboxylesterase